mmetsp:Transcript_43933/g.85931  ORF Transcript_43933/g.85931 Transcript_43933/m.85931 type:complete len:228 (+) Transcript_43933:869-1552(+)
MLNKEHGTQQEFLELGNQDVPSMAKWAIEVHKEWQWLFSRSGLVRLDAGDSWTKGVVQSNDFVLVLFLDGLECGPCKTAKTNMMRLSAGLRGLDVSVAYFDCEPPENRAKCQDIGLPQPPHAPQVWAWRSGEKTEADKGEMLYNPNEVEPHFALQMAERLIRLSQAEKIAKNAVQESTEAHWDHGKKEHEQQAPPFQYRPMWNGPKGRASLQVGGGSSHGLGQLTSS